MMHEIGLRILIRKVQLVGAQHDKALTPIYSYFKDHYFRIFFRCIKGKNAVDDIISQHKYLLYCNKCRAYGISESNDLRCSRCDLVMSYAGPMWMGALFDEKLAAKILKANTDESNARFLETIATESKLDAAGIIGFYDIHELCKYYKKNIPTFESLIANISSAGFKVSRTHFNPLGIKTDMPVEKLVELL